MLKAIKGMVATTGELFAFLWARKLWWLFPMLLILLLFGLLIALGNAGGVGHLIYTLF